MTANIFFYSRKIKPGNTSIELFNIMQANGILPAFKCVCVNDFPKKRRPFSKKDVPVIMLQGVYDKIFYKQEAFQIIKNMLLKRKENMAQQHMIKTNSYKPNAANFWKMKMNLEAPSKKFKFNTLEYSSHEMSATSDSYANVKETDNTAFPQNFVGIGKDQYGRTRYDADSICTAPESKDVDALKKHQTDSNISKIKKMREEQDKMMDSKNDDLNRKRVELSQSGKLNDLNKNITGNQYYSAGKPSYTNIQNNRGYSSNQSYNGYTGNNSYSNNSPNMSAVPKPKMVNGRYV